jgi:hypothetical protein
MLMFGDRRATVRVAGVARTAQAAAAALRLQFQCQSRHFIAPNLLRSTRGQPHGTENRPPVDSLSCSRRHRPISGLVDAPRLRFVEPNGAGLPFFPHSEIETENGFRTRGR